MSNNEENELEKKETINIDNSLNETVSEPEPEKKYDDEYSKKPSTYEYDTKYRNDNLFEYICSVLYVILIAGVFLKFVPICEGNWFTIGMGKLVLLGSVFGIVAILNKNYFAAFFISLFAFFFLFHEIIIFYDDYAIKLGKELNPGGVFRSVLEVYRDAFSAKCGAFWSLIGSGLSLILICVAWIKNIVSENIKFGKPEIESKVIA